MDRYDLLLVWHDKHWQSYGAAFHLWLKVNFAERRAELFTTACCIIDAPQAIEAVRRNDVMVYAKYLEKSGFSLTRNVVSKRR